MKNIVGNNRFIILKVVMIVMSFALTSCDRSESLFMVAESDQGLHSTFSPTEPAFEKVSSYQGIKDLILQSKDFLTRSKEINDFRYTVTYQPHILLAVNENKSYNLADSLDKQIKSSVEEYRKLHYIKFSMRNTKYNSELLRYDIQNAEDYSERVSYYSFYVNRDICLIENEKDTLKGAFVNFERTFDTSPELNMVFVFERKSKTPVSALTLVFDDVVYNNGKLKFEFKYNSFAHLNSPEINKILL